MKDRVSEQYNNDFILKQINEALYTKDAKTIFNARKPSNETLKELVDSHYEKEELPEKKNLLNVITSNNGIWEKLVFSCFKPNSIALLSHSDLWDRKDSNVSTQDTQRFFYIHFRAFDALMSELALTFKLFPKKKGDKRKNDNYSFVKDIKQGKLTDFSPTINPDNVRQMIKDHTFLIKNCCLNYELLRTTLNHLIDQLENSKIIIHPIQRFTQAFFNYLRSTMDSLPNNADLDGLFTKYSDELEVASEKMGFVTTWLLLAGLCQDRFEQLLLPIGNNDSVFEKSKETNVVPAGARNGLFNRLEKALENKRDLHPSFQAIQKMGTKVDDKLIPAAIVLNDNSDNPSLNALLNPDETQAPLSEILKASWGSNTKTNLIISGRGGIGKTISLLTISVDPRYNWEEIPVVFIPLRALNSRKHWDHEQPLSRWMQDMYGDDDFRVIQNVSGKEWKNAPSLILILDGYNELIEDSRAAVKRELTEWDKPGVQIIISSRSVIDLNGSFIHILLQPLDEETKRSYIRKAHVKYPDSSSKLWEALDTPLMLHLFISIEKYISSINDGNLRRRLAWKKSIKTSSDLMWNNLQTEIIKAYNKYAYTGRIPFAEYVYATLYMMPYLCWRMVHEKEFTLTITERQIRNWIREELQTHTWNEGELEYYPQLNSIVVLGNLGAIDKPSTYQYNVDYQYRIVTESDIFFSRIEGTDSFDLPHQNFRDFLAAIHIYNVFVRYKIECNEIGHSMHGLPNQLTEANADVLAYFAYILSDKEISFLWECCRSSQNHSYISHILELYAIQKKYNFTDVDFTDMDLQSVNLNRFRRPGTSRLQLPTETRLLNGLKISQASFNIVGHTKSIASVVMTPDLYCASIDLDGQLIIWYLPDLSCVTSFHLEPAKAHHTGWTILKSGKDILVHGDRDVVYKVEIKGRSAELIPLLDAETDIFKNVKTVTHAVQDTLESASFGSGHTVFRSPFDSHAVVSCTNGMVKIYDGDKCVVSFEESQFITDVDFCNPYCACATAAGTILIYDLRFIDHGPDSYVYKIECDPGWINCSLITENEIITGGSDNLIRVWSKDKRKLLRVYEGHKDWVNYLSIDEHKNIISASGDGTIRIWTSQNRPTVLSGHKGWIRMIKYLGNGKLASASDDGSVRIWNTETKASISLCEDPDSTNFRCLDYSTKQKLLVAANDKGNLYLWHYNYKSDKFTLVSEVGWHCGGICTLSFSADGKLFAAGDFDGNLKIWTCNRKSCKEMFSRKYEDSVLCVQMIQKDGVDYCVAALKNGRVFRLELNTWAEKEPEHAITEGQIIRNITLDADKQQIYISSEYSSVYKMDYDLREIESSDTPETASDLTYKFIDEMEVEGLDKTPDLMEAVEQTIAELLSESSVKGASIKALNGFYFSSPIFNMKNENGEYVISVTDDEGKEDSDFRELLISNTLQ